MNDLDHRARWLALYTLCLGDLLIVLDMSIVNVALPSIQADLGFSQTALAWVVNAYLLTFGGFLLLSGRLGDLLGNKRVFQAGVVSFTVASIACGLAPSAGLLVAGRAVQGLGGAAVSAVALALIMGLFSDPGRARQGDGRLRLRDVRWRRGRRPARRRADRPAELALDLPGQRPDRDRRLGAREADPARGRGRPRFHPPRRPRRGAGDAEHDARRLRRRRRQRCRVDLGPHAGPPGRCRGAAGRRSWRGSRARRRHWSRCGSSRSATSPSRRWSACCGPVRCSPGSSWRTLYMQQVLGYDALDIGLAFLPTSLVMAYCSLKISDRLVMRFGIRPPLVAGLSSAALSLCFSRGPRSTGASWSTCCLPSS